MMRRMMVLIGAVLLAAAVGGLVWNQVNHAGAARPFYSESDLAVVTRGTLIATVNATGAIEPRASSAVAFRTSGNVAEILVQRGERVKSGQVLARLDTTILDLQLEQAEANLVAAEANLAKLKKGPSAEALAAAQANLQAMQEAYDALAHPSASAIAAAQANYESALAAYNRLLHPDATELAIAKADLDKAKAALDQAQAAYDRIGGASNPFIAQTPQALQLQTATLDYQKALNAFNAKFNPSEAQLKAALAQVQAARDQLARLEPTEESLAQARARLAQAREQLARLTPSAEELAQAEANVAAARAARDLARAQLEEAVLLAPLDGTVTVLDLDLGEFVQAGRPVATIADLDHLRIILNIDETDIPRVQIGQPVALELDAFPGQIVSGTVSAIAPAATTVQGVVNYEVEIQVQPGHLAVKPGMTANANIQVARKENVLLVPTRAIRAQGNKRLVTILENGQPKEVSVTLGLSNDQETEILEGLSEGMLVLTIAIPTNAPMFGGSSNRSN